jgi:hypothetical protein
VGEAEEEACCAFETPAESCGHHEKCPSGGCCNCPGVTGPGSEWAAVMLGRGDAANRFNLFDNMSAYPRNAVWFAYQHLESFQTGIGIDPASRAITNSFAARRDENLYRLGVELMPFCDPAFESRISIAFQTQYIASTATDNSADAWGTPEIVLKYALYEDKCSVLSAVLGIEPQTSTSLYELHERTTRVVPGLLFYQAFCGGLFLQGGFQVSIAERNAPSTIDWALSAGYWLFADNALLTDCPAPACCRPCIIGIIPQVELLGKDVVSHETSNPYDIPADPSVFGSPPAPYREARNVVDITAGLRVLFGSGLSLSAGGSWPVTGGQVRRGEFLAALIYNF